MDRAKIVFIAIAVVAIGAALALGYLAKGKFDEAAAALGETESNYKRLSGIYSKEVFPSSENINLLRESCEALEARRQEVTNALTKLNVPMTTSVSPSAFIQALSQQIKAKVDKAPIVGGVKSVSPTFAFGFDAYVGSNPAMPLESEVPALSQQLILISWLTDEMYASGISSITKIERTPFDQATQIKNPQSALIVEVRKAPEEEEDERPAKKGKKKNKKIVEVRAPLFTSQKLNLEFTAKQQSLVNLLNSIASMKKAFVVVTDMNIKKSAPDIKNPAVVEAQAASLAAEQGDEERSTRSRARDRAKDRKARLERNKESREKVEAVKETSDLPKEMRIMSGPDVDPLLSVKLSLEVYNFVKEAE